MAALNRTFALAKANGIAVAVKEAEKLRLEDNHFYFTLLGELYSGLDKKQAIAHLKQALVLAKNHSDRKIIQQKLDRLLAVPS